MFGLSGAAVAGLAVAAVGAASAADSSRKQTNAAKDANAANIAAGKNGSAPDYALPYITGALDKAQTLSNTPYTPYTGQLQAAQNPYTVASQGAIQSWANGSPQSQQLNQRYSSMASGQNPFATTAMTSSTREMNTQQSDSNGAVAQGANNSFIGRNSSGVDNAMGVSGAAGQANNAYLGQNASGISGVSDVKAGTNKMLGMDNPYLNKAIDQAQGDTVRNYNLAVRPREDAQMQASGSFGNTGLLQMQGEGERNLAGELGRISSGMRMQDYASQQQLGESDLNRQLGAGQYNANNQLNTQQYNSGVGQNNLNRNAQLAQGQGQFNAGQGLDAAKFDSSMGNNVNQFNASMGQNDLARNSQLMQQQGQFNAGQYNNNSQFNAGQFNNMNQFNTGQQNSANQWNAGQQNQNNQWNVGQQNQNGQFNAGMGYNMMNQGLNGLQQMDNRGLQAGQALGLLGNNQQNYDQQGLNNNYQQWQNAQNYGQNQNNNYIDNIRQLTFGSAPQQRQALPADNSTGNAIMGAIGGGMTGYQMMQGYGGGNNNNSFAWNGGGNGSQNTGVYGGLDSNVNGFNSYSGYA